MMTMPCSDDHEGPGAGMPGPRAGYPGTSGSDSESASLTDASRPSPQARLSTDLDGKPAQQVAFRVKLRDSFPRRRRAVKRAQDDEVALRTPYKFPRPAPLKMRVIAWH
eukprot:2598005-Rhodomonas_salina.1